MAKMIFSFLVFMAIASQCFAYSNLTTKVEGSEGSGNNIVSVDTQGFVHVSPKCSNIARITSNVAALVVKNAPGVVHTVIIGRGGVNSNLTLFDNATTATGFIIASIDTSSVDRNYILDAQFKNGLVAFTSAPSLTVSRDADISVCTT